MTAATQIDRLDLDRLLPLDPRRAAVGAYWRRVATGALGDGWRFAHHGERLRGGEWTVYRPARGGRYARSAAIGYGPAPPDPTDVVSVDLTRHLCYADVLRIRVALHAGLSADALHAWRHSSDDEWRVSTMDPADPRWLGSGGARVWRVYCAERIRWSLYRPAPRPRSVWRLEEIRIG